MSIVSALKGKGISKAQKQDALWGEMLGIVRIVKYQGSILNIQDSRIIRPTLANLVLLYVIT